MLTRRNFLKNAGGSGALALLPAITAASTTLPGNGSRQAEGASAVNGKCHEAEAGQVSLFNGEPSVSGKTIRISLEGQWQFRTDPDGAGERGKWFTSPFPDASPHAGNWEMVSVPHTWQVQAPYREYMGLAWYRKIITAPERLDNKTARIEFEAVFHSAKVWLNGEYAGEHLRKGYTAFCLDISALLRPGENYLVVQVDNRFNDKMLPRNDSYDWAADGGITRPVSLLLTPKTYIENLWIAALPDLEKKNALLKTRVRVVNDLGEAVYARIVCQVIEEKSGRQVLSLETQDQTLLEAGASSEVLLPDATLDQPLLWHFDHPNLYRIVARLHASGQGKANYEKPEDVNRKAATAGLSYQLIHSMETHFGIRKIEIKEAGFYLNGERVWLAGVERMAGSHPLYGMAEPASWILHNHEDMKNLNCIFTRVHWQQDKRVLDYCDRQGMLIQVEVPTWGGGTFKGMKGEPDEAIMQNGLEQLREMIDREYNHPSVFSWGLCNEIGGQNPPAYKFAENMLKEAKSLDPYRLCAYASNSLHYTPEKDVTELMDFIEWNEYYESWLKGDVADMEKNLQAIHEAFPDKPLVISEYGWCRCTPERKEGDEKMISILRQHNAVFRKYDYVAGLIFFSYNDYRTHMGDKGIGVLQQRVHGVIDLYGAKKSSYQVLRAESSPVESLEADLRENTLKVKLLTRETIPAYPMKGYRLSWTGYADQDVPLEISDILLPELKPGERFTHTFKTELPAFERIVVEVFRPTGSSVISTLARK